MQNFPLDRNSNAISLLSCLYLNCPCLRLLSHRLLQFSSGWSSKGSSFSYSVCSKGCCYRLVGRLPRTSHISAFMFDHLHWLPLIARIQLKVLTLIYRSHIGQALRYLRDIIRLPSSVISLRPLRSLDRHDLFVPRARTSMAQTRAFAIIGPSLWNQLLPSTRSTLLTGVPSASFRSLKTAFFSLGLSHWKRF